MNTCRIYDIECYHITNTFFSVVFILVNNLIGEGKMEDKNFNLMTAVLFIFNGLAAALAIIFYILGVMPTRESQFGLWLFSIIMMPLYGIIMLFIIGFAVFHEYRKTIVKGPKFYAYDFRVTHNEKVRDQLFDSNQDLPDKWNINIQYTLVNDGDWKARFRYDVILILDVKDKNSIPLESIATQSAYYRIDHTLKATQELEDELCTFLFNEFKTTEGWNKATIKFVGNYRDHNRELQEIDFTEEIVNPNVQKT